MNNGPFSAMSTVPFAARCVVPPVRATVDAQDLGDVGFATRPMRGELVEIEGKTYRVLDVVTGATRVKLVLRPWSPDDAQRAGVRLDPL